MRQVVIAGACRTPIGSFQGALTGAAALPFGAIAQRKAVKRAGIIPQLVVEVFMGNLSTVGVRRSHAGQASIFGELTDKVSRTTINKTHISGSKSIMMDAIAINEGKSTGIRVRR
ncbi:MAG: hypothetical protein ACLP05_14045 [Candidatus Kryptoniota bacterium]